MTILLEEVLSRDLLFLRSGGPGVTSKYKNREQKRHINRPFSDLLADLAFSVDRGDSPAFTIISPRSSGRVSEESSVASCLSFPISFDFSLPLYDGIGTPLKGRPKLFKVVCFRVVGLTGGKFLCTGWDADGMPDRPVGTGREDCAKLAEDVP